MVSEATIIIMDNSEYMRNGDYLTNRFNAQLTTIEFIFQNKINTNLENMVGLLSHGGNGPEILSTLTNEFGKILSGIHKMKLWGKSHFLSGIQVAALALKYRQIKMQNQKIIVFIGSPIDETVKDLEKLAKKMKKNNIAIDVISFGEEHVNIKKLEAFILAVNNHDNSHLVTVPSGPKLMYEFVADSPVLDLNGLNVGMDNFGGINDLMDPDLALALKLSLEEEKVK